MAFGATVSFDLAVAATGITTLTLSNHDDSVGIAGGSRAPEFDKRTILSPDSSVLTPRLCVRLMPAMHP